MKPVLLKMEGIKSFISSQEVNFEELMVNNLFGITGATRSGKTTVLDALIISLYGDNTRKNARRIINLKSDRMKLDFTFELSTAEGRMLYNVRRIFKRNAGGHEAVLSVDGLPIVSGVEKVNEKIAELLGLSRENFCKVVILEQGEFAGFLKMTPAERNNVVGRIFNLDKYGDLLWEKISKRTVKYRNAIARLEERLLVLSAPDKDAFTASEKERDAIDKSLKAAESEFSELSVKVQESRSLLERRARELEEASVNEKRLAAEEVKLEALKERFNSETDAIKKIEKDIMEFLLKKAKAENGKRSAEEFFFTYIEQVNSESIAQLILDARECELLKGRTQNEGVQLAEKKRKKEEERKGLEEENFKLLESDAFDKAEYEKGLAEIEKLERSAGEVAQAANLIITHIHEGESCPVCGGSVGKVSPLIIAGKDLERYHTAKQSLERLKARIEKNSPLKASYALKIDALNKDIEKTEEELVVLRTKFSEIKTLPVEKIQKKNGELILAIDEISSYEVMLAKRRGEEDGARVRLAFLTEQINASKSLIIELKKQIGEGRDHLTELEKTKQAIADFSNSTEAKKLAEAEKNVRYLSKELALKEEKIKRDTQSMTAARTAENEFADNQKKLKVLESLSSAVKGKALVNFMAEEYIQSFTYAANKILEELTLSDYRLIYGKEFEVIDNNNGGQIRGVDTLSGGETFLVSLALAIAIGKEISANRQFEFFFIDEGFGTLDNELIETVLASIEKLRSPVFNIGLITHRQELMSRITGRLEVQKDEELGSFFV